MAGFFCINTPRIQVDARTHIVKAADYAKLLQANALIQAAEEEAARIKEEAQKAFAEEKERGYTEGLEEGRLEMAERTFEAIAKGIDFIESLEKNTVDIVIKSLQRILDDMPPEERIVSVVRRALAYVRSQKNVVMRVNPQELAWVQKEIASLSNEVLGIDTLRVVGDKMLDEGACILESDLGIIDASLSVQIKALRNVFESHLQKS